MAVINPFDFFVEPFARELSVRLSGRVRRGACALSQQEPAGPRLKAFLASIPREPQNIVDFLVALNQRLQHDVRYLVRMEPGVQTPEETLTLASGSCRDTRLAAGAGPAPSRPRGAFRLRLSDPAQARPEVARRAGRRRAGLHRPARLDRSLSAGRRLDRARSHLRAALRRRPFPLAATPHYRVGRADLRRRRAGRGRSSPST